MSHPESNRNYAPMFRAAQAMGQFAAVVGQEIGGRRGLVINGAGTIVAEVSGRMVDRSDRFERMQRPQVQPSMHMSFNDRSRLPSQGFSQGFGSRGMG